MRILFTIVLYALAASTFAFSQQDGPYQVGYAVNLSAGDTVINFTNDGAEALFSACGDCESGAVPAPPLNGVSRRPPGSRVPRRQQKSMFLVNGGNPTQANVCVNTYVFDPQEEEIGCCACLVTPNGLNSLSVKADLISNPLTPAIPTSAVIKLVGNMPGQDPAGNFTQCNPATVDPTTLAYGAMAWGATLEPNGATGGYSVISFPFLQGNLSTVLNNTFNGSTDELTGLTQICAFIQSNGTGYGICGSCQTGALTGTKR
jgi:hypothetical protein